MDMTWNNDMSKARKHGRTVIGWLKGWPPTPMIYQEEGAGWDEDQPGWYAPIEDVWLNPTHWMPMPEPPK